MSSESARIQAAKSALKVANKGQKARKPFVCMRVLSHRTFSFPPRIQTIAFATLSTCGTFAKRIWEKSPFQLEIAPTLILLMAPCPKQTCSWSRQRNVRLVWISHIASHYQTLEAVWNQMEGHNNCTLPWFSSLPRSGSSSLINISLIVFSVKTTTKEIKSPMKMPTERKEESFPSSLEKLLESFYMFLTESWFLVNPG